MPDDFDMLWPRLAAQPSMSTLRPSTLAQYQRVARRMHHFGVIPYHTESIENIILLLRGSLSPWQMRIAQALLNTHCGGLHQGAPISAGDWQPEPKKAIAATWEFFVPRRIRQDADFGRFADCLATFVGLHRPEVRLANNIRHRVALLWSVLITIDGGGHPSWWRSIRRDHVVQGARRGRYKRQLLTTLNRFLCLLPPPMQRIHRWEIEGGDQNHRVPCLGMPGGIGFTGEDICRLKKVAWASSLHHLIVTLLSQTGLRRRAVAWLRLDCVVDRTGPGRVVRRIGVAMEKGMRVRHFPIGAELRACVERYLEEHGRRCTHWLFPNRGDQRKHVAPCTIQRIVKQLCGVAGVSSATGTRGFRKFVVRTLIDAGNALEYVSKWLGHQRVATTYGHYWDVSGDDAIIGRPTD
jgi:hypothetical protein